MSKAVRWQIPFKSVLGVSYRIDIYDEGFTGTPVQLYGGPQPFVTEENSNEDFFTAVRSQTGNIQICTKMPDGNMITLNELLPANNMSRPVRLINVTNSNAIEWQGFLACEAYTQQYTGIPQHLTLPVISVLEAMDSVEIELANSHPFDLIIAHLAIAMKAIQDKAGITLFGDTYITNYCRVPIFAAYIYNNTYFSEQDVVNGDNVSVDVHSKSCKAILEQVAKLFGCVWREAGQRLFLSDFYGTTTYRVYSTDQLIRKYVNGESITLPVSTVDLATANMSALTWRGVDHKKTVKQGAKRVTVTTQLKEFEAAMALEECPVNNLVENPSARQANYGEVHVNTNETFYSLARHQHMRAGVFFPSTLTGASLTFGTMLTAINYDHTFFWEDNDFRTHYKELVVDQSQYTGSSINYYLTSFMAYMRDTDGELYSGLMLCGAPKNLYWSYSPVQSRAWSKFGLTASNYLFKQSTPLTFSASQGFLRLVINVMQWRDAPGDITTGYITQSGSMQPNLTIAVQFGSKWLTAGNDGYEWGNSFTTIPYYINADGTPKGNWTEDMDVDETNGLLIPIPSFMTGIVTVYFYHEMDVLSPGDFSNAAFDVFIKEMTLDYMPPKMELNTDRSSNNYMKETGSDFKKEVQAQLDLATNANNKKLATMLWDDANTPSRLLTLGGSQIRPEVALLNKMTDYYTQGRQLVKLEAAHPTTAPLPRLRLNGINDGKKYLPLAESRDWAEDKSTLTCFETVNS